VHESMIYTFGRVHCCSVHAWAQCRASNGSIARILDQFVQSRVLRVKKTVHGATRGFRTT